MTWVLFALLKLITGVLIIFSWRILAKPSVQTLLPPLFRWLAWASPVRLPHRRHYTPATEYVHGPPHTLRAMPSMIDLDLSVAEVVNEDAGVASGRCGRSPGAVKRRGSPSGSVQVKAITFEEVSEGGTGEDEEAKHYDADVLTKVVVYVGIGAIATVMVPALFEDLVMICKLRSSQPTFGTQACNRKQDHLRTFEHHQPSHQIAKRHGMKKGVWYGVPQARTVTVLGEMTPIREITCQNLTRKSLLQTMEACCSAPIRVSRHVRQLEAVGASLCVGCTEVFQSSIEHSQEDSLSTNDYTPPSPRVVAVRMHTFTAWPNVLSRHPRSHSQYIIGVYLLAMSRFVRYDLSQQKEDLDQSILHYTEAILLPPVSRYDPSLNIPNLFFDLVFALLHRSKEFEQPEDVKYSIEYLRYLRGLPLDSFGLARHTVTTLLIQALGIQVKLEARDSTQAVNEMVDLCREFLGPNISADFPVAAFVPLGLAVIGEWVQGRSVQSLDKVVECQRDAARLCPPGSESHPVLYALAVAFWIRFLGTHPNEDYEEGTALLERILDPNQPGECSDSVRDLALHLAGGFAFTRSVILRNPEYSEIAISRLRTYLNSSSIDGTYRLVITSILVRQNRQRFRDYNLPESLEEANSYASQLVDISSYQNVEKSKERLLQSYAVQEPFLSPMERMTEKIPNLEELLSNTPLGTPQHKHLLSELGEWYNSKYYRTNDISDIEESIKYSRLSLDATHSHDRRRAISLSSLRDVLLLAFEKTSKIHYLDEPITIGYDLLELNSARFIHFHAIGTLVSSLLTRERLLGRREDLLEAIRLMSMTVDNQYAREPDQFRLSCEWAIVARNIGHPTTLTAYKTAMSLVEKSLSFAPTVSIQHTRLVAMGEYCQTMPLDYASFQIKLGRFEEAVETLEQEDPRLAKRFAEINEELEALTTSITPSGRPEIEDGVGVGSDGMDPFGRLVVKQRKLVLERDALISQIRGRPGLERFMMTPSFSALRSAASRGPVIVINHCEWSSDILIIFHNSLPCTIPTANDFYACANELRDELGEARKHGLDSGEYQDALCSVLKGLYELVGKPVIKKLRLSGVPEQSRIWWCPTSVFCSLPLHAMGPIPSSGNRDRYFSDLYIPSYTPSLSALIESRNHDASPQMLEKPSLLLVAQPEDSLPGVMGEIKAIRSLEPQVMVADLVSGKATPSSVVKGLRSSRFAHFACHGVLETGKPFDASFKLHGGSRLTLLDIARSRLPDAEFAFLSCCHTAEITQDSVADEALHLTAAMQYCGFRSVVGTMWAMADTDGRDLAKSFYKSLFSSQETSVPYYERSAGALRDATRKLRGKRGISLERWVNFVHYGCFYINVASGAVVQSGFLINIRFWALASGFYVLEIGSFTLSWRVLRLDQEALVLANPGGDDGDVAGLCREDPVLRQAGYSSVNIVRSLVRVSPKAEGFPQGFTEEDRGAESEAFATARAGANANGRGRGRALMGEAQSGNGSETSHERCRDDVLRVPAAGPDFRDERAASSRAVGMKVAWEGETRGNTESIETSKGERDETKVHGRGHESGEQRTSSPTTGATLRAASNGVLRVARDSRDLMSCDLDDGRCEDEEPGVLRTKTALSAGTRAVCGAIDVGVHGNVRRWRARAREKRAGERVATPFDRESEMAGRYSRSIATLFHGHPFLI
ncbi:CHAT domain-containing protein [Lactarius deliciosus]|nr:CHAT domain-containing protein [Lactarius deliciosus]